MNKKSLYTNVYPKPNLLCWLVNTFVDWREKLLDNHWKQSQKQFLVRYHQVTFKGSVISTKLFFWK